MAEAEQKLREALEAVPDWLFSEAYREQLISDFAREVRLAVLDELERLEEVKYE